MLLLWICAGLIPAQTPQFEAASIKASEPSAPRPGRLGAVQVVTSPGRLIARNATLKEPIKGAYALEDYQVAGGAAWITSARFDVEAKANAGSNRAQLLTMLQTLLAARFKLAVHRETKDLPVYALTVVKNGPKFRTLKPDEESCWPACPGSQGKVNHLRQKDLATFATFLTRLGSDRPVIDKTGLTGYFALDLDMSKIMEAAQSGGVTPTNDTIFEAIVAALPDELGLKMVATKAPVDVLTIDHVEKPSGN
jgi:uncharacterized protein (TIGR03435 family)